MTKVTRVAMTNFKFSRFTIQKVLKKYFRAFNLGGLYGNPGDYAWGSGGLDAIITQVSLNCNHL